MAILYLCEKPSQARDIARVLGATKKQECHLEGNNYIVTWCIGHLVEMAPPEHYRQDLKPWRLEALPVIPTTWHRQVSDRTKKQFNAVKKLLKQSNHVVIATDADREGETIAREVLELCNYKGKVQRLWLSALDEASIKKALAHLKAGHETEKLYAAGLARQRADWLIGLNLTMAATVLFGQQLRKVLSVGRVQTPTLKLVVDRDKTIETFKPKNYFTLQMQFASEAQKSFCATWQVSTALADEEGRCLNQAAIASIAQKCQGKMAKVSSFEEKQKEETPPLGLSLSTLQKLASSQFGFSAKQTLEIAQSLYETHKATTYPRTDCTYLPESQWAEAKIIIAALMQMNPALKLLTQQCDLNRKSPIWNDKKITAHHAIIPTTNTQVDLSRWNENERKLYDLICRYYLAQFLGNYIYLHCSVTLVCEQETFRASCNNPIVNGWQQALTSSLRKEDSEMPAPSIPILKSGEQLKVTEARIETCKTQPPARFTEGALIESMKKISKQVTDSELKKILKENAGIGTEATRADIIETLLKRDYLIRQGKTLVSTSKGRELIDLLPTIITDPTTTARWQQELDAIVDGTQTLEIFLKNQIHHLQFMLAALAAKRHLALAKTNSMLAK